jgi:hypothetical protein
MQELPPSQMRLQGMTGKPIMVNGQQLKRVEQIRYLGAEITADATDEADIRDKIARGWRTFYAIRPIITSSKIPYKLKRLMMNTLIIPVMRYASATWACSDEALKPWRSALKTMMRIAAKVTAKQTRSGEIVRGRSRTALIRLEMADPVWIPHIERLKLWLSLTEAQDIASWWNELPPQKIRGVAPTDWHVAMKMSEERTGINMSVAKARTKWHKIIKRFWRDHTWKAHPNDPETAAKPQGGGPPDE